jgi:hypothetical protein
LSPPGFPRRALLALDVSVPSHSLANRDGAPVVGLGQIVPYPGRRCC